MRKAVYTGTLAAALVTGYGAGSVDLGSSDAFAVDRREAVELELDETQNASLYTMVEGEPCRQVDQRLGLSGLNQCTRKDFIQACFKPKITVDNEGNAEKLEGLIGTYYFKKSGQWTPGEDDGQQ